jgi:hypothetical protein
MILDFINRHRKIFPIEKMYKVLKVIQSGCDRWKVATVSIRLEKKNILKEKMTVFYFGSKQRNGSPRLTIERIF